MRGERSISPPHPHDHLPASFPVHRHPDPVLPRPRHPARGVGNAHLRHHGAVHLPPRHAAGRSRGAKRDGLVLDRDARVEPEHGAVRGVGDRHAVRAAEHRHALAVAVPPARRAGLAAREPRLDGPRAASGGRAARHRADRASLQVEGGAKPRRERSRVARSSAAARIGPAPVTPLTSSIGRPSKFPTHAPTVTSGVTPSAQLSRQPVEVPVFVAAGKGGSSTDSLPKAPARASARSSTSAMTKAASREIARRRRRGSARVKRSSANRPPSPRAA